jgi:hypothetical protein
MMLFLKPRYKSPYMLNTKLQNARGLAILPGSPRGKATYKAGVTIHAITVVATIKPDAWK